MGNFAGREEEFTEDGERRGRTASTTSASGQGTGSSSRQSSLSASGPYSPFGRAGVPVGAISALTSGTTSESGGDKSDDENVDLVPTVFRWEGGGRNVAVMGTFNNWEKPLPMHRSGNDFTYITNVKRGKHAFKFLVDDEWRCAPDAPTATDGAGGVANVIDVTDFAPYVGDTSFFKYSKERLIPESEYGQTTPELEEYTREPPALPPHLRHIILNKAQYADPLMLPPPQRVSLQHLYATAIKDGMMVLGVTQRYKEKSFTTVFYGVVPSPSI